MTTRETRMQAILTEAFAPKLLQIADESARHAGHAGRMGLEAGETHYRVLIISEVWQGESRVARSRAVHAALEPEFKTGLHALSLTLRTPEEAERLPA